MHYNRLWKVMAWKGQVFIFFVTDLKHSYQVIYPMSAVFTPYNGRQTRSRTASAIKHYSFFLLQFVILWWVEVIFTKNAPRPFKHLITFRFHEFTLNIAILIGLHIDISQFAKIFVVKSKLMSAKKKLLDVFRCLKIF